MRPTFIGVNDLYIPEKLLPESDNPNFYTKFQMVARQIDGSNQQSVWRNSRDFLTCFVFIRDCRIENCFAKGWGQNGEGGAISALNSQVKIENDIFQGNEANSGGSIAAYNSNVLIARTRFLNDIGYISAGSLVVAGNMKYTSPGIEGQSSIYHADNSSTTDPYFCQIFNTTFFGSSSFEVFGAAYFHSIPEVYFRNVTFESCHTGSTGGAIGFFDTSAYLYECYFWDNYCGKPNWIYPEPQEMLKEESRTFKSGLITHYATAPRGGGAIFYTAENQPTDYWNYPSLIELVTQNCEFWCNFVADKVDPLSPQKRPGFDILFYKYSLYRSYEDIFTWPKEKSVAIYPEDEILRFTQYTSQIMSEECQYLENVWTVDTEVDTASAVEPLDINTDDNPVAEAPDDEQTYPQTRLAPPTTRSFLFHTQPSILDKLQYHYSHSHSWKLQSPTPTHSQSPTCSTGQNYEEILYTSRTHIITISPSYYWELNATATRTALPPGERWPAQTTIVTPPPSNPGYLPDWMNEPTQSWWGEVPNPSPSVSISFYGEPAQTPYPEAYPTNLGTAWYGHSYKTMTITNSKTLTVSFSKTVGYLETNTVVHSYSFISDGTYSVVTSPTERVPIESLVANPVVITNLYISYEYSALTPTQTLDKNEVFVENPTKTQTITYYPSLSLTLILSTSIVYIDTNCKEVNGIEECEQSVLEVIKSSYAGSVYVFIPSETVLDVIQLSRKQKRIPRTPVDKGVILGIAAALCALVFGVTVGVMFLRRRMRLEQARLAEDMGDQFEFSGASDEEVMDDNDGVTATIDVPSEDLNQTFDEADNWI